jgi:class 3 adenylate cyclase
MHTRTLGFLFTDLRGYTKFLEERGDAAGAELVRDYRSVVRDCVRRFEGSEVATEGDSLFATFGSVRAAVVCASEILRTLGARQPPIHAGVGVEAGEAGEQDVGYVAATVNVAARLCALAPAGDLFVTDTVRALVRGGVDLKFQSVGTKRLKGIAEPMAVWKIDVPGAARVVRSGKPPRTLVVATLVAMALALGQYAFVLYLVSDTPILGTRWSSFFPASLNPLLLATLLIFLLSDTVVLYALVRGAPWATRTITRTMVATSAVVAAVIPISVVGIAGSAGSPLVYGMMAVFGLLWLGLIVATSLGLYRRRMWAPSLGLAFCALCALSVTLLPVALGGAWSLAQRRENALY